ncbi:MAG: TIGR03960 family B12-binding radical SAM protein, partial [Endomicrobium sp.]|nr:TIGR03960 family B12-binding radical SAM protein [Endomicrobium sp.]
IDLNSYSPDMSAEYSIVLCFPDVYEIGSSNLGLEILYHLINEKKLARCERVFAPDMDMESILKKEKLSLFSLESRSSLKSFDVLGFTIQCELAATNIINILYLSDISIFSKDRKDDEPLIIAGGPTLINPEPFCDFFDLFVLGDGEEAIEEVINISKEFKKLKFSKIATLKRLSKVDGVYVPSLYSVKYNDDNTVKSVSPISNDVKPIIKKRILNLKNAYFPKKKIIPLMEVVSNKLNIEITRGCLGRCRFCQASKYYYPWRQRPLNELLDIVKKGMTFGFEEIAFLSLSCSDYKYLDMLLVETNKLYKKLNFRISLPSLRCNERSLKIVQYINRIKRPTLTFAPEAGTDRLRNVIGKYLSEKQIVETLLAANAMGWKVIKLYFMIGLPTETDGDIAGIERLVRLVKKKAKNLNFNITISPFVPKAQTAFQWLPMANPNEIEKKINLLNRLLPANVKAHDYKTSILEALISRADRRFSKVIYKAWKKGARFDQWTDKFKESIWREVLIENKIDLNFYLYRNKNYNEVFPWDHLFFGISKEDLYSDYIDSIGEAFCFVKTKQFADNLKCFLPENYVEPKVLRISPVMRLRLRFSKKGVVRFISHLEQIEVFRRVARRSCLPVAFTAGFNPKVKSSYGPPLSVGQESSSEYMELYFTQKVDIESVRFEFSKVLPNGFALLDVKNMPLIFPSIGTLANILEYEIRGTNITQKKINKFLSQDLVVIKRKQKGKTIEIDVKPLIKSFKMKNGILRLQLRFGAVGFIKPEAILGALELQGYIIERTNLYIETKNGTMYNI